MTKPLILALALLLAGCGARDPVGCAAGWVIAAPFLVIGSSPWDLEWCQEEVPSS